MIDVICEVNNPGPRAVDRPTQPECLSEEFLNHMNHL